ncbi:MAG: type pilus assembly protein PilW [Acidobacteriota bacterium]|jgi:type II secretory pathway pseudopilin PulG|nr:type pilus assembly protein PilW [Acidobacteriota bacterium]
MSEILPDGAVRQRGFTLVELAVSLFVTVTVLLGVLALFDFSNKLARAQTNVADMQQSLRVAQADVMRYIRMAGRGGLPLGNSVLGVWSGWAVDVSNNVADDTHIGVDAATPEVVPGSDVLTIRGTFSSPLYQANPADPASFTVGATGGKIQIASTTPTSIPQDLSALKDAIKKKRHEALLLVSPKGNNVWAVVELDPENSKENVDPVEVAFKISGGLYTDKYSAFSPVGAGVFNADVTTVAFVGILEEYRFYARRELADPNDDKSDLTPKLSRARVYPGTQVPWGDDTANWRLDIADNIFDLQVALAFNTSLKADEVNGTVKETADGEADDWLYNGEKDPKPNDYAASSLSYIRLSTLARTDRRDKDYEAPLLVRAEDHSYDGSPFNGGSERMYRRRILRTTIDMRNLG